VSERVAAAGLDHLPRGRFLAFAILCLIAAVLFEDSLSLAGAAPDFTVIVLAEPALPEVVRIAAEAARWGEARLVLVVGTGEPVPAGLPPDAVVFEAPEADPDGAFASLVGGFAAALDGGTDPGDAFRSSIVADGWTAAPDD